MARITRKVFEEWLSNNRPDLVGDEIVSLQKKGYYRKDLGESVSFRGFKSWREALNSLAD